MRILCVTSYYKPAYVYGGPVKSVAAVCEALARAGQAVTVFTTNANGPGQVLREPVDRAVEINGVEVNYYPVRQRAARYVLFYAPQLGEACAKRVREFDVVYVNGTWTYPMYAAGTWAHRRRVPYVVSPRGSFMAWSMTQRALKKRLYLALIERRLVNRAAVIVCTTNLEREQLKRWGFEPDVVVAPNGLDGRAYEHLPERGALRGALGIRSEASVSLFVGRLHPMKRLDLVIDAFARVVATGADAHLVIVGPGGDGVRRALTSQVAEFGLGGRVHLMGLLTGRELLQAYSDADMLVLLSHRENFGMVVVEAMAAGLPVLLTEGVGLAQEVAEAGAGYCVEGEPGAVAARWARMLDTPAERHAMGRRGKMMVQERFDSAVVAERTIAVFRDLVSAQR